MAGVVHASTRFSSVFREGQCAFIPYVMAGDPDLETTSLLIRAVSDAGAAAIELGVPYGDPLADGPTIAASGVRALACGVTISHVLQLVRSVSSSTPPIVLFTYFNPVYQYGIERFARDAAQAGAAGVIVPDIALEEGQELRDALSSHAINMPLLVAPSTPPARAARIARESTGFVYVVSRLGVTGAGSAPDFTPLRDQVRMLRALSDKPLAVGFGISQPEHVREIRHDVDGFIVGSALIDSYAGTAGTQAAARAFDFSVPLVCAAQR
jgi:tryptophan synthase alpha chain